MEPANLTPHSPDGADLDEMLTQDRGAALPDDGFSARVLAELPPRRPSFAWARILTLCLGAAAGLATAVMHGVRLPTDASLVADADRWAASLERSLSNPGSGVSLGIAVAAVTLAFSLDAIESWGDPAPRIRGS